MRLLRISKERIAALSLVVLLLLLITIIRVNGAIESYYSDNNNDLPIDGLKNLDEDDEKDFHFPFSDGTSIFVTNSLSADTRKRERCNGDQIMMYLAEIQVINPETILQIASYKDIDSVCRKVQMALESIDTSMASCNPLPETDLYKRLTAGVRVLVKKICIASNYQLEFKKYMSCYQELHNEYIDCAGPAEWIVDMEDHELCNQYKIIADCYYTQTAMLCGIKAAKTLKELIIKIINAVIQVHCPEVKKNPVVNNPMTERGAFIKRSNSNRIEPEFTICLTSLLSIYQFIVINA